MLNTSISPTPDSVTSSKNKFVSPSISNYESNSNLSPNTSVIKNVNQKINHQSVYNLFEPSSSNDTTGTNTFNIFPLQFIDSTIDKNGNKYIIIPIREHAICTNHNI